MRSTTRRMLLAAAAGVVTFLGYAPGNVGVVSAQDHAPVMATRLYTGADGQTHVDQVDLKIQPGPQQSGANYSENRKMGDSFVVRGAPGLFEDWHNADVRRYVVPISGRAEVEVSGGQMVIIEPGHIYIAEDLTGKGHTFRVVGKEDWVALFVNFAK